ncbi:carbohydrate ABC transporter permease [Deferrisoma sp.]
MTPERGATHPAEALRRAEERLAWVLIALPLTSVLGVTAFPLLHNAWTSLHEVRLASLGGPAPFAGLANYLRAVFDPELWRAVAVTVVYATAGVSLSVMLGLAAALVVNLPFRGRGLFRALFLFPYVAPAVSVAFVWRWLLDPVYGVVNWALRRAGAVEGPVAWLSTEPLALGAVVAFEGWRYFPFAMLFILARLQAVPRELYEAARIDGAGPWQRFWNVTWPELRGVLALVFVVRFLWTVNKFDDVFLLTGGAAGTRVVPLWIYDTAFRLHDFGTAAAGSTLALVVLLVAGIPLCRRWFP